MRPAVSQAATNKCGHLLRGWWGRFPAHTRTHNHATHSRAFPPWRWPSSALSASEMGRHSGCSVGEAGLAPETLQNIPLRDRWLAGWMVAGKHARQQTTTPALYNSYGEGGGKLNIHCEWGLTPVVLFLCSLTILPQSGNKGTKKKKERLDYAISGELLGSFYYGIWDNFTGISAYFTATDHNERHARLNFKTPRFYGWILAFFAARYSEMQNSSVRMHSCQKRAASMQQTNRIN